MRGRVFAGLRRFAGGWRFWSLLWVVSVLALFAGCSSGGSGGTVQTQTTTYTIGGTVSGLSGSGLVLEDNGGNNTTITANGSFTFSTAIASGGAYSVTVLTQPSNPAQTCSVANGSGTASSNVTNVQVSCGAPTYTIGGTVSGLSGSGLVLQDNGGNNLTITANGSFTFSTAIASGGAYDVTVLTQPSSPAQLCSVTDGSGTVTANVTSVQVTCTALPTYTIGGTVTGLSGTGLVLQDNGDDNLSVTANGDFAFSTALASGSPYNVTVLTQPSSPAQNCTVADGSGTATADVTSVDVTCANLVANEWVWMAGSDVGNQAGTYGTQGTAAAANTPGARDYSVGWTDASGNLWLFGGEGFDSTDTFGGLNDLWEFSGGQWTWVSGSSFANELGRYGTEGTASSTNYPGERAGAAGWTDAAGNFWLFGGALYYPTKNYLYNDLWEYSGGEWKWVSGSSSLSQDGEYGTEGTAAAGNVPGARETAVSWIDSSGNFWIFGGEGFDSVGTNGGEAYLNDLWKYSGGEWTWMSGSETASQSGTNGGIGTFGTYGTLGSAAASNVPGARFGAASWTDQSGNLWLFGGYGFDSAGSFGYLNDLWKYSAGEWTWMGGSNLISQTGTYGTLGTAASTNIPGARSGAFSWTDKAGNFWLFGGGGFDSEGTEGELNDLWENSNAQWIWIGGSDTANQSGVYGTLGTPAASNIIGARVPAAGWTDATGRLWIFGGQGLTTTQQLSTLNDLWEYLP